ncbi:acetyltransferase [Neobacillus cucumis]|uniref:acetyltransferase n=1 Tax=Neobacillus cucumis TaxID=1740721 RepID=UPI00203E99EF|nr:acetyltransferase [Neobacillus cucumis]MCM3724920.1 acetyltransferase [Neobacillus cucumis]
MNIVVIGHGGHSKVVSDIIRANKGHQIIGYLDDKYEKIHMINNLIFAPVSEAVKINETFDDVKYVIAIGDNTARKSVVEKIGFPVKCFEPIIHPSACISPSAKIGPGTVVMPQAVINADVIIGNHSIINSCAVVEHDSLISDYVHLCPNTTIAGTVTIGEGTCLGSGGTIIPNKKIGEWTMIGAGATVIEDLPSNCLAMGIPAKVITTKQVNAG